MIPQVTFLNLPPAHWMVLLLAAIAAVLFFAFYRFSVPTKNSTRLLLAGLRTFLVLTVFFIILDPYQAGPRDADWVGVLVDTSQSMDVRDGEKGLSRLEELRRYFKDDRFWNHLKGKMLRKVMTFDSELAEALSLDKIEAKGDASNLFSALREINRRYREDPNLLGWILFSDGAATDASAEKMSFWNEMAFPWMAVGVGSETEVKNLTMEAPSLEEPIFVGEIRPLKVEWRSTMEPDTAAVLNVRLDGKSILQKEVKVQDRHYDLELTIPEEGPHRLDLELVPLAGEGSKADNHAGIWFQSKPRHIHVFYAESFYKDENRFKKALEEDADFKVSFATSLIGFAKQHSVPFMKDPLYGFPKTREETLQYDAIVLSDVKRNLLSSDQITWIRELVEEGGGALVMIGGIDSFGDGGYVGTEIEAMLPVEISEEYKKDTFLAAKGTVENPFRPVFVKGAESHPLVQFLPDAEENLNLWKTMPLLGGYNYVGRSKPGATVILQHPLDQSTFGPRIILAAQNFGHGKTLAFTSDVTPNWGQWFQDWKEEKHGWLFARFWRTALKWLTENRLRHRLAPIEVKIKTSLVEAGQPFEITASLPSGGADDPDAVLHCELLKGTELLRSKDFSEMASQKEIRWPMEALEAGDYLLRIRLARKKRPPVSVEKSFFVHPSRLESRNLKAFPKNLRELSHRTEGDYLPFSNLRSLESKLEKIRKIRLRQYARPLWHQPLLYLIILALLCLDWFLRKKKGLE